MIDREPSGRLMLALMLALPFVALWVPPLFDLDEGAFTASTTEMFLRGDFLSSYLLGAPRVDKPILIYWLQAASVRLLGFGEWGFRLPSAILSACWIGLTYGFVSRIADRPTGLIAALVISTAAGLVVIARAATADALLNCLIAAAGYAAWLWLREERPIWRWLSFAAMGLGFLAKGPVAVVVPGAAVFLWCLSRRDLKRFFAWAFDPWAILVFVLIAAPWFVIQTLQHGGTFIEGFFLKHNLSRYGTPMEGHGGSHFYYVPVVLVSLLPHTGLLLSGLSRPRELWHTDWQRYGLLWFIFVFVFFSFSGTKLPHYVYYGYAGLVLILARQGAGIRNRWLALLPAVFAFALLLALPWLLDVAAPRMKPDDQLLAKGVTEAFPPGYRLWFGAALSLSLFFLFEGRLSLMAKMHANGLVLAFGMALFLLPAAGTLLQEPIRQAGRIVHAMHDPLVMHGINNPSFQTYAGRQVEKRPPRAGDVVFTRESQLSGLPAHEVIFRQRSYVLARVK